MSSLLQVFSVFLKKPAVAITLGLIAGLILGWFVIGWWIWPVEWVDGTPEVLRTDLQEDYLRMVIDSFSQNSNLDLAKQRYQTLGSKAGQTFLAVEQNPGSLDPAVVTIFRQVVVEPLGPIDAAAEMPGGKSSNIGTMVLWGGLIVVLVVFAVGGIYLYRNIIRGKPRGEASAAMQAAEVSRQAERTDFQSLGLAPPVTQTMTTYVMGDDLYDESFSIDTQGGDFLGEYGVGVSETIGVGDPKKVTALEVWLFDKNDIKTATKVLMSPHAYNDSNLRARLEAKGELVVVEPQGQIVLETATLQLLVTVNDLEYGVGALPPESYFDRVTLELAIWPKEG